ncbi:hydroxymyristoyl-ACP dehydratase [uncultured Dokdonia sp.]|uniref:3-hydroxyacyl-ACP dehydratase FabZ family protein n=1 Tax=uncultured Dokdonia sp. TaxID=575653 RepID=UPI002608786E|nr:hydroxymyristoyl-ACP dehydratase [uncultured Dokdonia sp.]
MNTEEIIALLPYIEPFLFVNDIEEVTEQYIKGSYTFKEEAFFYKGHFKDHPVTPGVILTECMAQIGLVSLGIYLLKDKASLHTMQIAFTSADVSFLKPVLPNERVTVTSEVDYFRFNKLKCNVKLYNQASELVCQGKLAGIFKV